MCIMDTRDQVLRRKTMRLVKVLWQHHGVEEATWEREDMMRATYPFLFRDEGTWFSRLMLKWPVYMHGIVHVAYACDLLWLYRILGRNSFKGERMQNMRKF